MIWAGTADEIRHALDVAPAGETLALHAGKIVAPRGGFVVPRGMRIEGAHPLRNRLLGGTMVHPASPDDHAIVIPQGVDNVTLANLIVQGPEKAGVGDGIHLVQQGTPSCIELHNVVVWGCGRDGIHIESTTHSVDWLVVDNCSSNSNGRHGLFIHAGAGPNLRSGYYAGNGRCGILLEACGGSSLRDVSIEGNQRKGPASEYASQLWISGGGAHNVDACGFENWAKWQGSRAAITVENGVGVRIVGCAFTQPDRTPSRGVIYLNHCRACELGLNTWTHVTQRTDIDPTCTTIEVREPQATYD